MWPLSKPPSSVSEEDEEDVENGSDAELLRRDDREPFRFVLPEAAVPVDEECDLSSVLRYHCYVNKLQVA